uniref:Uncharacterized protein n=1 Tax=Caenorhabditis japonica TaxID=281687 RepID=A0A8R1EI85_CAEJA
CDKTSIQKRMKPSEDDQHLWK